MVRFDNRRILEFPLRVCLTGFSAYCQISMMVFPTFSTLEWSPYDTQFYITCFVCFIWNFFCLGFVSRRMCPNFWFIRGLVEFGEATGTFWTGTLALVESSFWNAIYPCLAFEIIGVGAKLCLNSIRNLVDGSTS